IAPCPAPPSTSSPPSTSASTKRSALLPPCIRPLPPLFSGGFPFFQPILHGVEQFWIFLLCLRFKILERVGSEPQGEPVQGILAQQEPEDIGPPSGGEVFHHLSPGWCWQASSIVCGC